jgi:hypothetical protein
MDVCIFVIKLSNHLAYTAPLLLNATAAPPTRISPVNFNATNIIAGAQQE